MRRAGQLLLILVLGWAALLNGAVELWALVPAAVGVGLAAVLIGWSGEPRQPRSGASILFWLAVGLTAYTAVQAIPLPAAFVRMVSPHEADVWARSLRPLSLPSPAWHPLTLDPQATRLQIVRGATYIATFFAAVALSGAVRERAVLERTLVTLAVIVAIATVAHIGLEAHRLWGVYAPRTGVGMIAPFFNHNQLSGFLNIGLLIAAGSTLSAEPIMPRMLSAATVIGLAAMVVFLGSRGAVASAVVGLLIVGALSWRSARFVRKHGNVAVPLLVACAGAGILVFASHDSTTRNLQNVDFSKVLIAKTALLLMAPQYPIFGVGRGSFESAFPEFRHDNGWMVFTHPENVVAQWTTEWGIPVSALAFVACAVALRPRTAMARSRPAVGAFAALVALFLQNLVDFSSEFPAVVMALAVCAALVVGGSGGRVRSEPSLAGIWSLRSRRTSQAIFAAVAIGAAFACVGWGHDLLADRAQLLARGDGERDDAPDIVGSIRAHPAEPYFAYVGATRAAHAGNSHVLAWVDRALERAPVYGPAHLVLARWLRTRSPAQARLEYRVAQEQGGVDVSVRELASMVRDYYDALELAPAGDAGVDVLNRLSQTIYASHPASAARVDEEILRRHSGDPNVLTRIANEAWTDVETREPWCPECEVDAARAADALEHASPKRCDGYVVRAHVLLAQGHRKEGLEHLRTAVDRVDDPARCVERLARLAIDASDEDEATSAITRLADSPCVGVDDCARNLISAAELERARRSPNRALVYLRRAANVAPARDDVLALEAQTAEGLGLHAEALEVYRQLTVRHPDNVSYRDGVRASSAAIPYHVPE
jgi:tetratricopeptide (TPR) repeat protein